MSSDVKAGGGEPRRWTLSSDYGKFEGLEVVARHELDAVVRERDEARAEVEALRGGNPINAAVWHALRHERDESIERVRVLAEALETCLKWVSDESGLAPLIERALASVADSDPEGASEVASVDPGLKSLAEELNTIASADDAYALVERLVEYGDRLAVPASSSGGVTRGLAEALADPDRVAANQAAALDRGNVSRFVESATRLGEGGVTPEARRDLDAEFVLGAEAVERFLARHHPVSVRLTSFGGLDRIAEAQDQERATTRVLAERITAIVLGYRPPASASGGEGK